MALDQLANQARESVITEDDRIMHTTKMVERSFGLPVADLGTVAMVDGNAVLKFDYAGGAHTLRWARQSSGAIFWYVDASEKPLVLGSAEKALSRLRERLDG
jgi:hypothetical protein